MAIYHDDIVDINLNTGTIHRSFIHHAIGGGDNSANRFGIRAFRDGEPVNLGDATCEAFFRNAEGTNIALTSYGTVDYNVAYVTLPQACYNVEGQFTLAIKLIGGGVTGTMRIVDGIVDNTGESGAVAPVASIPTYQEILAVYDQMLAAKDGSVRFDITQELTCAQQKKARENVSAASAAETGPVFVNERAERDYRRNHRETLLEGIRFSNNHISETDGSDVDNGYNVRTDDYIPIYTTKGNAVYYAWDSTEAVRVRLFWYDESKTKVGMISTLYSENEVPFEDEYWSRAVPYNAKYLRVLLSNETWDLHPGDLTEYVSHFKLYIKHGDTMAALPEIEYFPKMSATERNNAFRPFNNNTRVMTDYFPVGKGTIIRTQPQAINTGDAEFKMFVMAYDYQLQELLDPPDWGAQFTAEQDCYVRVGLRKSDTDEITDEILDEIKTYMDIEYYAPSSIRYSDDMLNGRIVDGMTEAVTGKDIIKGQLWEYGYITVDGENSINQEIIRMRNSVNVEKYTSIILDCSQFTGVYGRYLFFGSDGGVITATTLSNAQGNYTISVPDGAKTFRVAICTGWTEAGALLVSDGRKLKIQGVEAVEDAEEGLKGYYKTPIDNAVSAYIQNAEANRLGYLWISDIHLSTNHTGFSYVIFPNMLTAARKAAEQANIDFIVIGGDVIDAESEADDIYPMMVKAFKPLAGCAVPVVWLLGNHDDNAYGEKISKELAISIYPENSKFHNDISMQEDGYFYFDIPAKHKRIVCLNASDYPSNKSGRNWWSLSQAQVEWICSSAFNTEHDIVILSHMLPHYEYNFWNHGDEGGYHTDLMNAMQAYNQKGSITLYGNTYNFSRQTNNKIKLMHAGHWHWENDPEYLDIKAGGVECIMTGCAKQWAQELDTGEIVVDANKCVFTFTEQTGDDWHANSYGYDYTHWYDRTSGTVKESLFDLVSVNSTAAHCYRIGAGLDRTFTL